MKRDLGQSFQITELFLPPPSNRCKKKTTAFKSRLIFNNEVQFLQRTIDSSVMQEQARQKPPSCFRSTRQSNFWNKIFSNETHTKWKLKSVWNYWDLVHLGAPMRLNYRIQGHFWRLYTSLEWLVGSSVDSKVSLKWLVGWSVDFKVYYSDCSSARQSIPTSYQQARLLTH